MAKEILLAATVVEASLKLAYQSGKLKLMHSSRGKAKGPSDAAVSPVGGIREMLPTKTGEVSRDIDTPLTSLVTASLSSLVTASLFSALLVTSSLSLLL